MKLGGADRSPFFRKVRVVLEEKGICAPLVQDGHGPVGTWPRRQSCPAGARRHHDRRAARRRLRARALSDGQRLGLGRLQDDAPHHPGGDRSGHEEERELPAAGRQVTPSPGERGTVFA